MRLTTRTATGTLLILSALSWTGRGGSLDNSLEPVEMDVTGEKIQATLADGSQMVYVFGDPARCWDYDLPLREIGVDNTRIWHEN